MNFCLIRSANCGAPNDRTKGYAHMPGLCGIHHITLYPASPSEKKQYNRTFWLIVAGHVRREMSD
jgi:hypothetical protein